VLTYELESYILFIAGQRKQAGRLPSRLAKRCREPVEMAGLVIDKKSWISYNVKAPIETEMVFEN